MESGNDVIIVGGGLSGLTLAYYLAQHNLNYKILEASPRLGGRIQTIQGALETPLELGATWITNIHVNILGLMQELGLKHFPQFTKGKSLMQSNRFSTVEEFYVPQHQDSTFRIAGGTQALIDALTHKLDSESIALNKKVISITENTKLLEVNASDGEIFTAKKVVLCLPPQLVGSHVHFTPSLPIDITSILQTVQTWMAGSIKFVVEYKAPFWREKGYSGMFFSRVGIIGEMHDHTNYEENKFGFTGFLNAGATAHSQQERKTFVLQQLNQIYGEEALHFKSYSDKIWNDKFILGDNEVIYSHHQNNGNSVFQRSYLNGKLFFSGTESVPNYSGYMEGAVISAKHTCNKIVSNQVGTKV